MSFEKQSFDLILNCSTIEHVGLGRYGGSADENGDLKAMRILSGLLKPHGVMLLTIPVGEDMVSRHWDRVYGSNRLPKPLEGFSVQEKQYWTKDEQNRWAETTEENALRTKHSYTVYALGCFSLIKPR